MSTNTERFLEQARRATEKRMQAAERIAETLRVRDDAKTALDAATADVEAAFKEAENNGWSKTELRRLRPADMSPKPRQQRSRRTSPARPAEDTSTAPQVSPST